MALGVFRLTAVAADGTAPARHLEPPFTHRAQLRPCTPEAHNLGAFVFRFELTRYKNEPVALLIVTEPDLTDAEHRIQGLFQFHLHAVVFCGGLRKIRQTILQIVKELFQADCEGLQLLLLDDQRNQAAVFASLNVKNAFSRRANGSCSNSVDWVELNFHVEGCYGDGD